MIKIVSVKEEKEDGVVVGIKVKYLEDGVEKGMGFDGQDWLDKDLGGEEKFIKKLRAYSCMSINEPVKESCELQDFSGVDVE